MPVSGVQVIDRHPVTLFQDVLDVVEVIQLGALWQGVNLLPISLNEFETQLYSVVIRVKELTRRLQ